MMAVATDCLLREPMRKTVSAVTGVFDFLPFIYAVDVRFTRIGTKRHFWVQLPPRAPLFSSEILQGFTMDADLR